MRRRNGSVSTCVLVLVLVFEYFMSVSDSTYQELNDTTELYRVLNMGSLKACFKDLTILLVNLVPVVVFECFVIFEGEI